MVVSRPDKMEFRLAGQVSDDIPMRIAFVRAFSVINLYVLVLSCVGPVQHWVFCGLDLFDEGLYFGYVSLGAAVFQFLLYAIESAARLEGVEVVGRLYSGHLMDTYLLAFHSFKLRRC
jgi:hypothetical protein